jgi:hypothetical protein
MDKMPTYNAETDTPLGAALAFHEYVTEYGARAEAARKKRDMLIVMANREGVSAYRISKALGVAESTVGRIIGKR